jgi:hypothetical protein
VESGDQGPEGNKNTGRLADVTSPRPMLNGTLAGFTGAKPHAPVKILCMMGRPARLRYRIITGPRALAAMVANPAATPTSMARPECGRRTAHAETS